MAVGCDENEKMKSQIFHIAETTSTNDVLKKMLLKNALEEGFTVVADFQTDGRGQVAKKWESERGKNLLFSTVFYPSDVPIQQQFLFSKAMALGLRSALTELLNEEVRIKWPNDIYWHDKKLCGILIETSVSGGFMTQVIVGVGINVNQTQFVSDAPNPVSMCQIAGKEFDRNTVLEKVVVAMLFENSNRDANLQRRYFDALYRNEGYHPFYLKALGQTVQAKIISIEPSGVMCLETVDRQRFDCYFKEVEFVL